MPPRVFISSTSRDLIEYRQTAIDTCLKLGLTPVAMEHFEATDADARTGSLRKLDQCDIYLGIFAHRYGYIPDGSDVSVTEMEYWRARERKMPMVNFVIDPTFPWRADLMELEHLDRLTTFKRRVTSESIVNFFRTPTDLQSKIALSLLYLTWKRPDEQMMGMQNPSGEMKMLMPMFGPPSPEEHFRGHLLLLTPHTPAYDALFREGVMPVAEQFLLTARRIEDFTGGAPLESPSQTWDGANALISAVMGARMVIAEISERDPDVFYDLGIAHTLGKPTVILARKGTAIPLQFRALNPIFYEDSAAGLQMFRQDLAESVVQIVES